ncbi:MAG: dipeptide epimerase [Proteobacteria bacterium]|nr:dipeptide epimerase [Pseudomonadota bacterium]
MKITQAKAWIEHFDLKKAYAIARETFTSVDNVFISLETQDGTVGYGVASPAEDVTGETAEACLRAAELNLEQYVKGQDIRCFAGILRKLEDQIQSTPAAIAAIDIALHDLFAKRLGLPLVDFLGKVHHSLATSVTIGISSVEESLDDAKEYVSQGFKILKVKIGRSLELDIERLTKIRELVGNDKMIRVDGNQGYSGQTFRQFIEQAKSLDLELIEQPLDVKEDQTMKLLPEKVRKIAAADESLHELKDALKLSQKPHMFGIYNIKLMKCGGIQAGRQIAEIAHTAGIKLMWGCMDESIIGISAALHAAFSSPATRYLDLDGSFNLKRDFVRNGFELENGNLKVSDRPGLGVIPI